MLLGLLSDVHSNLHALEAVLDDVDSVDPDTLVFLGDVVGYNAFPQACVEIVSDRCEDAVLGNHDKAVLHGGEAWFNPAARAGVEHSRRQLDKPSISYLSGLPLQDEVATVHLVHGSPRAPISEYVFPDTHPEALEDIVRHPSVGDARAVAMGHTHVPFVRELDDLLVVNVGSVGQPRDGDPRACWCVIDTEAMDAEHRRVDYDIDAAAEAIREAGLPHSLAERLHRGN